ncbi:hypothetical protein CesoFtcFv8_010202 [Champsocephalus esox]|uniref:Uncharacterized protein n=1 Tax=Champsocephalus esox TaxID=159716 RepID=A0AAN8GZH3_9TELE|nr:hypothetical protein CesoFtcFv8_010202 [Champsocephalus esox]
MLLLYLTLSCVTFGSSFAHLENTKKCYGSFLKMPFMYIPPIFDGQMFFTPSNGGSRKLVMDKRESKDPRLKMYLTSVQFTDLTVRDEGTFSVSKDGNTLQDIIHLEVIDCNDKVTKNYRGSYSFDIPTHAEYLEFIPLQSLDLPQVLWNRSDPATNTGGRGRLKRGTWEMKNLNQDDMGLYHTIGKDNALLSWVSLNVTATKDNYKINEQESLLMPYPFSDTPWTVTFKAEGQEYEETLLKAGRLHRGYQSDSGHWTLPDRTQYKAHGIEISPVEVSDSGTFRFRDQGGHLAKIVELVVYGDKDPFVFVGIAVGIFLALLVCCCCVRKCCCQKSSSKVVETAPPTATVPASYYPAVNQPAGTRHTARPANNYSYQPYSQAPGGPTAEPSVNVHVNPLQPEGAPLGRQEVDGGSAPGSSFLSSDPGPRFEMKLTSPLPLSAESNFSHVYTSAKLNFL